MDWKKFAKGETTNTKEELSSLDSLDERKVSFREINEYERNKRQQDKELNIPNKVQKTMEKQGFSNPSKVSQDAYEKLRIASSSDKFVNTMGFFTTLDPIKQASFNYYNNQLQHNMLLASQNDELIKQNDVIIDQNEDIIKLLKQIANK